MVQKVPKWFEKWLSVADTTLVRVSKPRFGSKYSGVLRSPHKLKFAGSPLGAKRETKKTKKQKTLHVVCSRAATMY